MSIPQSLRTQTNPLVGRRGSYQKKKWKLSLCNKNSSDLYTRMLQKVLRALEISPKQVDDSSSNSEYPRGSDRSLSRNTSNQKEMPVPDIFHNTMTSEWEHPVKPKSINPLFSKLYSFMPVATKEIKLPLVDDPVNCLASTSVLPMDTDGLPKDQSDWHIEQALCRDFEASANAIRASA